MTSAIKDIVVLLDGLNQPSDDLRAGLALHLSHHQAGRPVLAVPGTFQSLPAGGRHLGRRALIGWNRSPEAARAVHDALPFLRRTEETIVLSVVDGMDEAGGREEAEQLVAHLRRHEVPACARVETSGPYIDLGGLLLDRVRENGCDLLVMGAYSRSRLHESWLGGASYEVFTRMTVPVLTSH